MLNNNQDEEKIDMDDTKATVTGYCVKCKEKGVELSSPEIVQTKKGGFMAKGKHDVCGTTVCAMMSKENAEKAVENGATKSY